jgi:plastocyanin
MTRRARLGMRTALVLALGIAGPAISQPGVTAAIRVFQFQPGVLEVPAGSRVTWRNEDDILHTVTSGAPGSPDGRFDLQLAGQGAQSGALFAARGAYPYYCARHPSMRGEIVVR